MNNRIQLKDFFSIIPNIWFLVLAGVLTLIIRVILSIFKALAINNGEIDDLQNKNEKKWKCIGFKTAFKHSFLSNGKDIKIDDYWLPAIIGYSELIIYPILMAKGWIIVIGAWIAF